MPNAQPSLTIVSVTGHQDYAQGSAYAIDTSFQELRHKIADLRCLLISPKPPEFLPSYITHIPCKSFSYFEYNFFMIYGLGLLIQTDFCLVVQNDGWVVNGGCWQDTFFDYDYIGAPLTDVVHVKNNRFIKRYPLEFWQQNYSNLPKDHYECQNGGFSLRSRRLLNAPREHNLMVEVGSFDPFKQTPLGMHWDFNGQHIQHAEDVFFSIIYRKFFEKLGMRFAPRNLAAQFGVEFIQVQQVENVKLDCVLGCHFKSLITLLDTKKVCVNAYIDSMDVFFQNELLNLLRTLGYTFVIRPEFNHLPDNAG